ncbi:hypothetical protein D3C75_610750 [compost metagenome]
MLGDVGRTFGLVLVCNLLEVFNSRTHAATFELQARREQNLVNLNHPFIVEHGVVKEWCIVILTNRFWPTHHVLVREPFSNRFGKGCNTVLDALNHCIVHSSSPAM